MTTIDLDTAGNIDLSGIGAEEKKTILFTAPDGWAGDVYKLTFFNSPAKNTTAELPDDLIVEGNDMTVTFEPMRQEIPTGNNYYEVFNITRKIIEFKGNLNIIK
jgi:hypothetical protein